MPADEADLLAMPDQASAAVYAAPNGIQSAKADKEWDAKICAAWRAHSKFSGWTGVVFAISPDGSFMVALGDSTTFLKANAPPGSGLYKQISSMADNTAVRITGTTDTGVFQPPCGGQSIPAAIRSLAPL